MNAIRLLAAVLLVLATIAPVRAGEWRIAPEASRLTFAGTQAGQRFEGRFKAFTATIRFDPDDLAASRVEVGIDMASAESGSGERDQAVRGADWFAVERFPRARFVTTSIRRLDGDRYQADAELSIRDVSRKVTLPFTVAISGDEARAAGELAINRTDYGVGQGQWASSQWVGLEVQIRFEITATRAAR